MKKLYNSPKLFISSTDINDILIVSKVEDVLDIFDVDVNEEL